MKGYGKSSNPKKKSSMTGGSNFSSNRSQRMKGIGNFTKGGTSQMPKHETFSSGSKRHT